MIKIKYRTKPLTKDEWLESYTGNGAVYNPDHPASADMCMECKAHALLKNKKWPPCGKDEKQSADLNFLLQYDAVVESGALHGMTPEEASEVRLSMDPVLWCMTEFTFDEKSWIPRWYQELFMRCTAPNRAALWGRRSGKSECMIALLLWYARYRIGGDGHDREYHIQVFANSESLAKKHWSEIMRFIKHSRTMHGMVASKEKGKLIELTNGVTIHVNVLSLKQLGQDAHLMWFDEAAFYESEDAFTAASAIRLSRPNTPVIMTSNSSGFRGKFWEFCNQRDTYLLQLPSYVNPEWNTDMEMFARRNYNDFDYETLILAEWGSAQSGVFRPDDIAAQSRKFEYSYYDMDVNKPPGAFRVLGNDWNEAANGVHFVVVEFNPSFKPEGRPVFRVIHKKIIRDKDYNHEVAQEAAYQILTQWGCDAAYLDDGGGGSIAVQRLQAKLRRQGKLNLAKRIYSINMSRMHDVPDLAGGMTKKRAKNLIVNTCQRLSENHQLAFPVEESAEDTTVDKTSNIIPQMRAFRIEKTDMSGRAVYSSNLEEHTLTAWMLAVHGCVVNNTDFVVDQVVSDSYLTSREPMPSEEKPIKPPKMDETMDRPPVDARSRAPARGRGLPGWRPGFGDRTRGMGGSGRRARW